MPGAFLEAGDTEANKTKCPRLLGACSVVGEKTVQESRSNVVERLLSVGKKIKQLTREREGGGGRVVGTQCSRKLHRASPQGPLT